MGGLRGGAGGCNGGGDVYIQLGGQYIPLKPHYLLYFALYNGLVLCGMNEVGNLYYGFENYRTGVDMGLAVLPGTPPHI